MKNIMQSEPSFDENERRAVASYMDGGGWITEFKKTREFEDMIARHVGAKYCSVVSNGTIALICSLYAAGVKPNDEIIVPDHTFVATPNSAEILGAKAVFVDIEKESLCIDFEKMKQAVTPKTKAVIAVSLNARHPSKFDEMAEFCREKGIALIEDAAQALGSKYNGKFLGTIGDIGCFSFSTPKIISTGQGGAIVTNDSSLIETIRKMRNFGRASDSSESDHFIAMGWNFKFTDLQAVIGIEQMKKLDFRVKRRKAMGRLYYELLGKIAGISLIPTNFEDTALCAFDVLAKNRDALAKYLKQNGIGTRHFYPALHSEPVYARNNQSFPIAEEVARTGLWLPSSNNLTDEEIAYVCEKVAESYKL